VGKKKRISVEDRLAVLQQLAADTNSVDELTSAVVAGLGDASNLMVELAAKLIVDREIIVPEQTLIDAFDRLCASNGETDKACRAKVPLVEAMLHRDVDQPDFYLRGMKYVQIEPQWRGPGGDGPPTDSAAHLRGLCAHGLIRSHVASPASTMLALVDLLNDSQGQSRAHAARAISLMNSPASVPLLRLKVLTGDPAPEVQGECFRGMLHSPNQESIDFVAGYLDGDPDVAIEAATALGESHQPAAVKALIAAVAKCSPELVEAFYVSIGLSRQSDGVEFLLQNVRDNSAHACLAVQALAPARFYPGITEQVEAAVQQTGDVTVLRTFQRCFVD